MFKVLLPLMVIIKLYLSFLLLRGELAYTLYFLLISPLFSIAFYYLLSKFIRNKTWRMCFVVLDLFIPFYGVLSIVLVSILSIFFRSSSESEESENFYLQDFESNILTIQNNLEAEKSLKKDDENVLLEPYLDIINGNNTDLKLDACIKLSSFKDPSSISLLKLALQDTEYDVRYMANNALDKIEKKFMFELEQLSRLIEKHPLNIETYLQRAEVYSQLAASGILDEAVTNFFLKKAIKDLSYAEENGPENYFTYLKLSYVYAQIEDYQRLLDTSLKALQLELADNERNKILFFAAEASFNLRQFNDLNQFLSQINMKKVKYNKIMVSSLFWRGLNAS